MAGLLHAASLVHRIDAREWCRCVSATETNFDPFVCGSSLDDAKSAVAEAAKERYKPDRKEMAPREDVICCLPCRHNLFLSPTGANMTNCLELGPEGETKNLGS